MAKQQLTWINEKRTLRSLTPWEHNPRYIKDAQAERLLESFNEFGQVLPICIAPNGDILDGHQRRSVIGAADEYGLDYEVDVRVASRELTERERQKLTVYLHQGATGQFNFDELANWDLSDLVLWGFDEDFLLGEGFDVDTAPTESADAEAQIDKAAELQEKWQTSTGQLWRIGEHRLLCGDCTDAEAVARVMGGEKASIVFTDPPYGVSVGAKNRMLNSFQKAGRNLTDIESDDLKPEELKAMLLPAFVNVRKLAMADDCTVFMTAPQGGELGMMMMMMKEAGLPIRHVLIWKKNAPTFSMGRLDYDYQHEPILLTWGKRHKRPLKGQHRTSIWEIDKPRASAEHPTMKPPELYENAYLNNSDKGDIAFEPYAGSGTALIASQNTGRRCRAIEISPNYCAVILQRMQDAFPGIEIELVS